MVRTRSCGVKAGGKSSKKMAATAPAASAGGSSGSKKGENGNPVQAQPTPTWQREITGFLGNPAKKQKLEGSSNETNNAETDVVDAKPVEADGDLDKVQDEAADGEGSPKEKNATADNGDLPAKKETDLAASEKPSNGALGNTNGEKANQDVSVLKDTSSKEDNAVVSPESAEGGKD